MLENISSFKYRNKGKRIRKQENYGKVLVFLCKKSWTCKKMGVSLTNAGKKISQPKTGVYYAVSADSKKNASYLAWRRL
jgi:hypothetical protein